MSNLVLVILVQHLVCVKLFLPILSNRVRRFVSGSVQDIVTSLFLDVDHMAIGSDRGRHLFFELLGGLQHILRPVVVERAEALPFLAQHFFHLVNLRVSKLLFKQLKPVVVVLLLSTMPQG